MTTAISAGSEIDAWCTKCKLDLNHRIIAMNGPKIVRVECLTCRGHHGYRRPKSANDTSAAAPRKKRSTASASAGASSGRARTPLVPVASVPDPRKQWAQAVLGRTDDEFVRYTIAQTFQPEQLVRHKKFGDGVVTQVLEDGKVMVLFESGKKKLVHGRT